MSTSLGKGLEEIAATIKNVVSIPAAIPATINTLGSLASTPAVLTEIRSTTLPKFNATVDNANGAIGEFRTLIPTCRIVLLLLIAVLALCAITLVVNLVLTVSRKGNYNVAVAHEETHND